MRIWILALMTAVVVSGPAQAHKVIASVFASGDHIEGEVGFSNGDVAVDTLVEIFDGEGNKMGETKTDDEGFFTFMPTQRTVHVFRANLGAGHIAEARMEIEELPVLGSGASNSAPATAQPAATAPSSVAPKSDAAPAVVTDAQRALLADLIHHEINPLRREIAAYKEKNNLQTILGGIGYILGLFGIGFYIVARRRNNAQQA